jgi:hypothetical protein
VIGCHEDTRNQPRSCQEPRCLHVVGVKCMEKLHKTLVSQEISKIGLLAALSEPLELGFAGRWERLSICIQSCCETRAAFRLRHPCPPPPLPFSIGEKPPHATSPGLPIYLRLSSQHRLCLIAIFSSPSVAFHHQPPKIAVFSLAQISNSTTEASEIWLQTPSLLQVSQPPGH